MRQGYFIAVACPNHSFKECSGLEALHFSWKLLGNACRLHPEGPHGTPPLPF